MFAALTVSLALGAPVPVALNAPAAGNTPRLLELKPDDNGKIMVTVIRTEMPNLPAPVQGGANAAGGAPPPPVPALDVAVTKHMVVALGEVKELTITTADGKKLDNAEALKKLEKGGVVVVSGDGKPVSPTFLKVFKDDTLVLCSPELIVPQGANLPGGLQPIRPALPGMPPPGAGGIQLVPLPPNAGPGGAIQINVQGGAIQVIPAVPVRPVPPPVEKPVVKPPQK